MKYFLDTNILIDFITNREHFGKFALEIFKKSIDGEWQLWTSDNSITTTYYIIEKSVGTKQAKAKIGKLLQYLEIAPVNKPELLSAVTSDFKDYEDGVQYYRALNVQNITGLITRNKKDFKNSAIPILGPEEVLNV